MPEKPSERTLTLLGDKLHGQFIKSRYDFRNKQLLSNVLMVGTKLGGLSSEEH
jgi:hypothetical protein